MLCFEWDTENSLHKSIYVDFKIGNLETLDHSSTSPGNISYSLFHKFMILAFCMCLLQ